MTQEVNWAEILCEHIGNIVLCGDIVKFDRSQLDLFPDIVISYLYMFDAFLGHRVLRVKDCTTAVAV